MTRALTLILSATLAAACADRRQVEYAASVNVSDPELVAIGPDVEVVVEAREPVFRTNTSFWLYRGDRWYRSDGLRGGWVQIATPPTALTLIVAPHRYANYHADSRTASSRRLSAPRALATSQPRAPSPRPQPPARPSPPPPQPVPPIF